MQLAILDDYQSVALQMADWGALGPDIQITTVNKYLGQEVEPIAKALQPFDILVLMRERTRFPRALIERLPNLKLLATGGMRNAAIDMAAARERGIVVCGTGIPLHPAAEHAVALILDLFKKVSRENRLMHDGGWQGQLSESLKGKTLGLLGLGRLGERVARVGLALEMRVIAWSQNLTKERCAEVGAELVDKDALFAESDLVSIHLVLSRRTQALVGAREIELMKPTAYLVNTSRGPIIDEGALVEALRARRIAGAGLDVFDVEPLPADHPLRALDNAILTGHTGFVVTEFYQQVYREAVENIAAWQQGTPIRVLEG